MTSNKKLIFIIGPGGVGKSTCGRILAEKLGYAFLDLDKEFGRTLGNITDFIRNEGIDRYHDENSRLFDSISEKILDRTVFVLSSGFLIHDEAEHADALSRGISILLLPSLSKEEGANIVVRRQMQRGFGLNEYRERQKFIDRFETYNQYGDIKVYSSDTPETISDRMMLELERFTSV